MSGQFVITNNNGDVLCETDNGYNPVYVWKQVAGAALPLGTVQTPEEQAAGEKLRNIQHQLSQSYGKAYMGRNHKAEDYADMQVVSAPNNNGPQMG